MRHLRLSVAIQLLLAIGLCWHAVLSAQTVQPAQFEDGFEPACYGIANDRPGCVVVPFNQPPLTASIRAASAAEWTRIDTYVLIDRSGSMSSEGTALRNNLSSVTAGLACPPQGVGTPGQCFRDAWWGAGTFAYAMSGADSYRNHADLQPLPNFSTMSVTEPSGCCSEITLLAMSSTLTGLGSSAAACGAGNFAARATCAGSPAANAGVPTFGYPCFREDAAPFVVVFSDEAPSANTNCPVWSTVLRQQFLERGARFIGIHGAGSAAQLLTEFRMFASDTGSIDQTNGAAPLVFDGSDTNAPAAFASAMQAVRRGVPMNVTAVLIDDPADAVDVAAFVQRIEVINDGSNGCPGAAAVSDTNGDGFADTFLGVTPGAPVCFRLVPRSNSSVAAAGQLQQFPGVLRIRGDGRMPIADTRLWFVVPPA